MILEEGLESLAVNVSFGETPLSRFWFNILLFLSQYRILILPTSLLLSISTKISVYMLLIIRE
jgi:hypothetical protein